MPSQESQGEPTATCQDTNGGTLVAPLLQHDPAPQRLVKLPRRAALTAATFVMAVGVAGCPSSNPYQGDASVQAPSGPLEVGSYGIATVVVFDGARTPLAASRIAARSKDINICQTVVHVDRSDPKAPTAEVRIVGYKPGRTTVDLKYTHPGLNRLRETTIEVTVSEGRRVELQPGQAIPQRSSKALITLALQNKPWSCMFFDGSPEPWGLTDASGSDVALLRCEPPQAVVPNRDTFYPFDVASGSFSQRVDDHAAALACVTLAEGKVTSVRAVSMALEGSEAGALLGTLGKPTPGRCSVRKGSAPN